VLGLRLRSKIYLLWLALAVTAMGQAPTGGISGVVMDESGAVVPGAKLSISNLDTGLNRELTSNGQGGFAAPSLPAGNYEIKADAPGFKVLVR
jgi:hypothetical protein